MASISTEDPLAVAAVGAIHAGDLRALTSCVVPHPAVFAARSVIPFPS